MSKLKFTLFFLIILFGVLFFAKASPALALNTPTITATTKAPNQINLTWSAVSNPGYGYKVEIQSDSDSRYSSWTELSWQSTTPQSTTGGALTYLPYWVTEGHYLDVTDGSGTASGACTSASTACGSQAQAQIYGLMHNTVYNFRVRTYGKTDAGVANYSSYSNTATVTTQNPTAIRYVTVGGAGSKNGTSWANAWAKISDANGVSAGTLVLIEGGNYASDNLTPSNSGTQANRTVFQAYQGQSVNINTSGGVNFNGRSYVIVGGINVTYTTGGANRVIISGSRNAYVNSEAKGIVGTSELWGTVMISGNYNLLHNYYVHDTGQAGTDNAHSNIVIVGPYSRNIVQLGISYRGGHDNMLIKDVGGSPTYNQVKNSRHGYWGHGIAIMASSYTLVEGMTMYKVGEEHTMSFWKNGVQFASDASTIRRCVIYDGSSGNTKGAGFETDREAGVGSNNKFYNNIVYNNPVEGMTVWVVGNNGNVVSNNVFYNNGPHHDAMFNSASYGWSGAQGTTGDFDTNYFSQNGGSLNMFSPGDNVGHNLDYMQSTYATYWHNNYVGSTIGGKAVPEFVDISAEEVHLKSTSGFIGAGKVIADSIWPFPNTETDLGAFKYYAAGTTPPDTTPPAAPSGVVVS